MADNRPVQRSPGQELAYRMGFELGREPNRTQHRRRREVQITEDSITLIEEEVIIEERYW